MNACSYVATIAVLATGSALVLGQRGSTAGEQKVSIAFSGGHELDRRDHGRPVALIAAALGVPDQVFRDAFSHVRPARAGKEPDPSQVRRNKEALLGALAKYGVTNERLDEVSNYYRYRPDSGEMWPTREASGYAVVVRGAITKFVITNPGSGYSSAPQATVPGFANKAWKVSVSYGKDLERNGGVASVSQIK